MKKLLRAQRALPQTRLRVLRQKSAWTSAANSAQIPKEIAEVLKSFPSKQGVVLLDCAPAHLPRQVMAMARKCKLQLVYIPAQTTDYLQPLDLQGFSPFKQFLIRKHQELRSYSEHGLVPPLAWLWQCMQAPHEFWAARQWQKSFDAVGCNGPGQVHKALQHFMGAGVPWPGPDRPTPQQMQCVWPARRQMAHAYKALCLWCCRSGWIQKICRRGWHYNGQIFFFHNTMGVHGAGVPLASLFKPPVLGPHRPCFVTLSSSCAIWENWHGSCPDGMASAASTAHSSSQKTQFDYIYL